jgi:hypothetical protein
VIREMLLIRKFVWEKHVGEGADGENRLLFDATVVGQLPAEVCVTKNGTAGGVTQSCTLAKSPVPLEVQNIYWESADSYLG